MTQYRHNKKRNVGLISEFFSRYIATAFIEGRHQDIAKARKIWEKYTRPETELYKELVVFNALHESTLKNPVVAHTLVERARQSCKDQSQEKLDKEKTGLIVEINTALADNLFFSRPVPNYKSLASVQILMNAWRGVGFKGNLGDLAILEETVMDHLLTEKTTPNAFDAEKLTASEVDGLVVKLMTEKLNAKYSGLLSDEQKEILKLYVFSSSDPSQKVLLVQKLESLKAMASKALKSSVLTEGLERPLRTKLTDIAVLLETTYSNTSELGDDLISFYMTVSKLREEMVSKNETS